MGLHPDFAILAYFPGEAEASGFLLGNPGRVDLVRCAASFDNPDLVVNRALPRSGFCGRQPPSGLIFAYHHRFQPDPVIIGFSEG
jgi:hypothetical protein